MPAGLGNASSGSDRGAQLNEDGVTRWTLGRCALADAPLSPQPPEPDGPVTGFVASGPLSHSRPQAQDPIPACLSRSFL